MIVFITFAPAYKICVLNYIWITFVIGIKSKSSTVIPKPTPNKIILKAFFIILIYINEKKLFNQYKFI